MKKKAKPKNKAARTMHGLGELQAEVMEIVWELGEATVTQVHERITKKRHVTYTTVLVPMQKLAKKGWLKPRKEGRANVYTPTRSREEANGGLLRELLEKAFSGDPKLLLSQLMEERPMSDDELADLRKVISDRRKEQRSRSKK